MSLISFLFRSEEKTTTPEHRHRPAETAVVSTALKRRHTADSPKRPLPDAAAMNDCIGESIWKPPPTPFRKRQVEDFRYVCPNFRDRVRLEDASEIDFPPITMDSLEVMDNLGSGTFADVYRVRYQSQILALKKSKLPLRGPADLRCRIREVEYLSRVQSCRYIVWFRQAWQEDSHFNVLTSCYARATIQTVLKICPPAEVNAIVHDVSAALTHVHDHGLVHGDVKPANLLIDLPHFRCVLADFGHAGEAGSLIDSEGDVRYLAALNIGTRQPESDSFALGCVWWQLKENLVDLPRQGPAWHELRRQRPEGILGQLLATTVTARQVWEFTQTMPRCTQVLTDFCLGCEEAPPSPPKNATPNPRRLTVSPEPNAVLPTMLPL